MIPKWRIKDMLLVLPTIFVALILMYIFGSFGIVWMLPLIIVLAAAFIIFVNERRLKKESDK